MVEVKHARQDARSGRFFDRPAMFISTYAPGHVAGAAQCTLAYLQALTELHRGGVSYVGPASLSSSARLDVRESIFVGARPWWKKLAGVLSLRHIDRTTPTAQQLLRGIDDRSTVVYVNGEHAGRVIRTAKSLGLHSVFMPHNDPAEYLHAEGPRFNPIGPLYQRIAVKNGLIGCEHADLRLFLTEDDASAFRTALGCAESGFEHLSGMYFGYRPESPLAVRGAEAHPFRVLLNTNMGARQNEDGVMFFLAQVWSRVPPERGWELILAGGHPRAEICQAAQRSHAVRVVCAPTPQEMERVFADSSVCVATTFRGSGIKLRVGEALRRGLPVISSEHCARGYESISPDVLRVFRSPDEALAHLHTLASQSADNLIDACRSEYDRELSFEAGLRKMSRIADYFEPHA